MVKAVPWPAALVEALRAESATRPRIRSLSSAFTPTCKTRWRCWFEPHDLPIGGKILDEIDVGIRRSDKLLLIASEHSIKSDWVEEVKKALDEERTREPKQTMRFPIRLDDAAMDTKEAWVGLVRRDRNIADLGRWKDHDAYKETFVDCQVFGRRYSPVRSLS
jgi:hypothetical protein